MNAHALASPSSAAMWMACPASVTKADGRVRPSSKYAKEGTAAHRIAEMIVNGEMFPPSHMEVEGDTFVIGRNMLMDLNSYIDHIQTLEACGYTVGIEERVHLTAGGGMVWGTADCIAYSEDILAITDLKFGKGVVVSPDSAQLKIYALGALEALKITPENIVLTVIQPRLDPIPKSFLMSLQELHDWEMTHLEPAVRRIVTGDLTEQAGPHCRWCVRRNECYAYAHQRADQASDVFEDFGLDVVENAP